MPPVALAAVWGTLVALPLLLGAWLALRRPPRERTIGLVAAFGAGALVSAVSFELVESAAAKAPPAVLAVALGAGAFTYYVGDRFVSRTIESAAAPAARGRAFLLGATLDGIPESFILGLSIVAGGELTIAFVVAVAVSNLPEGMASAAELAQDGSMSREHVLGLWSMVVGLIALAAGAGAAAAGLQSTTGALAEAFAAGALLTMLIDDLIPEARERGGITAGLLGAFGFAVAFGLHQLGA